MSFDGDGRILATLAMVTQLGFIMVACVVAGFLLGWWLDGRLGTEPVLTIVLILGGVFGGMMAAYRMIMQSIEEAESEGGEGPGAPSKP